MRNYNKYRTVILSLFATVILFSSCKDFLNPEQEINITEDKLYEDWYEYRSIEMGLYGLQSELVEQIVILGELRGDLLQTTENASADMVEVYNFNISKDNQYASPTKFFKLISASNKFIRKLQEEHPEVMDANSPVTNYDRLYGEALCMRTWAFFNAVRIYGKVPFIYESLTSMDEINDYLDSPGTYVDSVDITFGIDGYENDTVYHNEIELEKQYYDQRLVIDYFTNELENKVKAVGVNHFIENDDQTWEVTVWNPYAMNALLGIMYLTDGDLSQAARKFEKIVYNSFEDYRYQLDQSFANGNWSRIFTGIDPKEHLFSLWFNKAYFQQNNFQSIFEPRSPHKYMLKPTKQAVLNWETIWDNYRLNENITQPWLTETVYRGEPGDFNRGYGLSYSYMKNEVSVPESNVRAMLYLKSEEDYRTASLLVGDVDTVVWKYSVNKNVYDQDADFHIYRAAGVHLWLAELYVWWAFDQNGTVKPFTSNAVNIVNDGSNYSVIAGREQLGVRGRVGFGGSNDGIKVGNTNYTFHPYTNEVTGYIDLTGDFFGKQLYLENEIITERARELAFEGERFYDLMRVSQRRNDPSYLAKKVSDKFPAERREQMYNYLLNEDNWYINYFD